MKKKKFSKKDIKENKDWAIVAYIFPPLVYLLKKDSKYAMYHATEGMKLFWAEVIYMFIYLIAKTFVKTTTSCSNFLTYSFTANCKATPWWVTFIGALVGIGLISLAIKGIINVLNNKNSDISLFKFKKTNNKKNTL